MVRYVAFLRGINVGGSKPVKMDLLRSAFEKYGYVNVKSVLASGNIVFDAAQTNLPVLELELQAVLKKTMSLDIKVMLRTQCALKNLAETNPFCTTKVTPETRLYVTFLAEKPSKSSIAEFSKSKSHYMVERVSDQEICCALVLAPGFGTTELMKVLEKYFGKCITTRSWNTVEKCIAA
jgi:uncharacterized protein (DUF1697 family)